jgi:hypothetical protein
MLKKFFMAAGLAAAFLLSPQVAEAKVKVHVGIGQPGSYSTIITIASAAVAMVIIPVRNILSPIRVMATRTAGQSDAKM